MSTVRVAFYSIRTWNVVLFDSPNIQFRSICYARVQVKHAERRGEEVRSNHL